MFLPVAILPAQKAADEWSEDDPPARLTTASSSVLVMRAGSYRLVTGRVQQARVIRGRCPAN